jgi:hypothetical protein
MSQFDELFREFSEGFKPLFSRATIIFADIKNSSQVQALRDAVKKGGVKMEEIERKIREKAKARTGDIDGDERVLWAAFAAVLEEENTEFADEFFVSLTKMKDSPEIAAAAQKILEKRRASSKVLEVDDKALEEAVSIFTERSKRAVREAEREAVKMGHNFISTSHIMIGLYKEGTGVAAHVLKHFKVNLADLISETNNSMSGLEPPKPGETVKLTKTAKECFIRARDESRLMETTKHNGKPFIGTEHLLLALLPELGRTGPLRKTGLDAETVRAYVLSLLNSDYPGARYTPTTENIGGLIVDSIVKVEAYGASTVIKVDDLVKIVPTFGADDAVAAIKKNLLDSINGLLKQKGIIA